MQNFMDGLYNTVTTIQPMIYLLVAACLIIVGVMFIIPSEKLKGKAKESLPYIVIGCGIVLGATQLAEEISSKFVF